MPFVILAHLFFGFAEPVVMVVAVGALSGHAFSPLLRLRGGKAIAVTFGVLLGLPHEILITFAAFMFLGFLILDSHAWTVMLSPARSLAYLAATGGSSYGLLFMLCVLVIFGVKHFNELKTIPSIRRRLIHWFQPRERET